MDDERVGADTGFDLVLLLCTSVTQMSPGTLRLLEQTATGGQTQSGKQHYHGRVTDWCCDNILQPHRNVT